MPGNRTSSNKKATTRGNATRRNNKKATTRGNNKKATNQSHRKSFFPAHTQMTQSQINDLRLKQQFAKVVNNKRMQNEKNYAKRLTTTGIPRRTSSNGNRAHNYFIKHVSKKIK